MSDYDSLPSPPSPPTPPSPKRHTSHVSHHIPVRSSSPDQPRALLPSTQTIEFNNSTTKDTTAFGATSSTDRDKPESDDGMTHGFFIGSQSTHDRSLWDDSSSKGKVDHFVYGDDGMEDIIDGIYRPSNDQEMWSKESGKPSPEVTPRHAISKRISNIGNVGHNIGLGHRIGVLSEDSTLTPRSVTPHSSHFVITEDSPVQTDVTWAKPDNASTFSSLAYEVQLSLPEADEWTEVTSVRQPLFRFYHTDNKLLIGKHQVVRSQEDIKIRLRVRCHGELTTPDRGKHCIVGSYSDIIEVLFVGQVPDEVLKAKRW